jgi:hypothetical protein
MNKLARAQKLGQMAQFIKAILGKGKSKVLGSRNGLKKSVNIKATGT